jgi:hypothetical protein
MAAIGTLSNPVMLKKTAMPRALARLMSNLWTDATGGAGERLVIPSTDGPTSVA